MGPFRAKQRARGYPKRVMERAVERYRDGEQLEEISADMGPSPNQIRGWFWRAKMQARQAAKEAWRPGGGWPESRGQKQLSSDDLLTFAELHTEKPYGLGYAQWDAVALLVMKYEWPIGIKSMSERGHAYKKDRRVRFHMRALREGRRRVRDETKEAAIKAGLGLYDEKAAKWLADLDLYKSGVGVHFVAEARAKRLDAKYGETPESREQDAASVLMQRLANRLEIESGGRDGSEHRQLPAGEADVVEAEVVDD